MRPFQLILVSVGLNRQGALAMARAARLAEHQGANVVLALHEGDSRFVHGRADFYALIGHLCRRGIDARIRLLRGDPHEALLREMERRTPDLLIRAAEADDMTPSTFGASTSERLLAATDFPIWVVRLTPPRAPRVVLAALSTSTCDDPVGDARVLATARCIATGMDAELSVVSHGMLMRHCGAATRLSSTPHDVVGGLVEAVEDAGADLVVVGAGNAGGEATVVPRGLLRATHASLLVVPMRQQRTHINPPPTPGFPGLRRGSGPSGFGVCACPSDRASSGCRQRELA